MLLSVNRLEKNDVIIPVSQKGYADRFMYANFFTPWEYCVFVVSTIPIYKYIYSISICCYCQAHVRFQCLVGFYRCYWSAKNRCVDTTKRAYSRLVPPNLPSFAELCRTTDDRLFNQILSKFQQSTCAQQSSSTNISGLSELQSTTAMT